LQALSEYKDKLKGLYITLKEKDDDKAKAIKMMEFEKSTKKKNC